MAEPTASASLGELLELARRRSRVALEAFAVAEEQFVTARAETAAIEKSLIEYKRSINGEREQTSRDLLASTASVVKLRRVSLQYDIAEIELRSMAQTLIDARVRERAAERHRDQARSDANVVLKREKKLEKMAERQAFDSARHAEFLSELSAER